MKKIFWRLCFIGCFFAALAVPARAEVIATYWQTEKSQHFIVYYQEAPSGFISELISKAEAYYNSIVEELGYRRFDFWSWDNRAKIYLYKNIDDFRSDTQRSAWTGAVVSVTSRTIKTFLGQQYFFDSLLPHEMTHIIFREFIGTKVRLPLWIDEGVASSQEKTYLRARMQTARDLINTNQYIKLDEFSQLSDAGANNMSPNAFYAQAASLIVFLIQAQGKDSFLDFSRYLRDGVDWKSALLKAYRFSSLEDLEGAWKEYMLR